MEKNILLICVPSMFSSRRLKIVQFSDIVHHKVSRIDTIVIYVDLPVIYVDLPDQYVDLLEKYYHN